MVARSDDSSSGRGIETPGSLSDLGARYERKTGLRQFLDSFEANSHSIKHSIQQKRA